MIDLVVSVEDSHLERLPEVAERLAAVGMRVDSVQEALGTLTGRAPEHLVPLLARVPGVASVEPGHPIRIA